MWIPDRLRDLLRAPRLHAPLLFIVSDLHYFDPTLLQPTDVVLVHKADQADRLQAQGLRAYYATPHTEGLRVSRYSVALALVDCPTVVAEVLPLLDWLASRVVPAGIVYLSEPLTRVAHDLVTSRAVARFFDVLSQPFEGLVLRRRPPRTPQALARWQPPPVPRRLPALTLPLVTRPLQVKAPPSPEAVAALLDTTNLVDRLAASWTTAAPPHGVPPLPLRTGHLALQLACGDFDGVVGQGPHRHLVHGAVTRVPVTTEVDGTTTTVDDLRVIITAVDATGQLTTLMGGSSE